jgi:hypothetical protein
MPTRRLIEITSLAVVSIAIFVVIGEAFLRIHLSHEIFYDVEMPRYALTLKIDSPDPLIEAPSPAQRRSQADRCAVDRIRNTCADDRALSGEGVAVPTTAIDEQAPSDDRRHEGRLEGVGTGFGRTGTLSLEVALEQ